MSAFHGGGSREPEIIPFEPDLGNTSVGRSWRDVNLPPPGVTGRLFGEEYGLFVSGTLRTVPPPGPSRGTTTITGGHMLDEAAITRAIVSSYIDKFLGCLEIDVAIVGAGPAGLAAGYHLARAGRKVAIFEKKLSIGGGMLGGGMLFNRIVVQDEALALLEDLGIRTVKYSEGYHTADAVEAACALAYRAVTAGLEVFTCICVDDVVFKDSRVCGLVINWTPAVSAGLHVDPLTLHARYVIDATGHGADVVSKLVRKMGVRLLTDTGDMAGEKSMDADLGERHTVENTREAYPGLYVAGMAANAVFGGYRMGPVFGGMLMSGVKAARLVLERLTS